MSGPWHRRKRPQTTHHRDIPDSLTITRERHAFEGQSLTAISSIRRRGVLLVLVVLPDGSRSLIQASGPIGAPSRRTERRRKMSAICAPLGYWAFEYADLQTFATNAAF